MTSTLSTLLSPLPDAEIKALSPNIIQANALFQGNQEILISHHGERYRLRITKNGKLILTK